MIFKPCGINEIISKHIHIDFAHGDGYIYLDIPIPNGRYLYASYNAKTHRATEFCIFKF